MNGLGYTQLLHWTDEDCRQILMDEGWPMLGWTVHLDQLDKHPEFAPIERIATAVANAASAT